MRQKPEEYLTKMKNDIDTVSKFLNSNEDDFSDAYIITQNCEILSLIYKYRALFRRVRRIPRVYDDKNKALTEINDSRKNTFVKLEFHLFEIEILQLFVVCCGSQLVDLLHDIEDLVADGHEPVRMRHYVPIDSRRPIEINVPHEHLNKIIELKKEASYHHSRNLLSEVENCAGEYFGHLPTHITIIKYNEHAGPVLTMLISHSTNTYDADERTDYYNLIKGKIGCDWDMWKGDENDEIGFNTYDYEIKHPPILDKLSEIFRGYDDRKHSFRR